MKPRHPKAIFWTAAALLVWCCCASAWGDRLLLQGRVLDKQTGRGIAGARIELANASGGAGYSRIFTGKNGEFRIDELPLGVRFHISVSAKGYASFYESYWEPARGQTEITLRFELPPEGILHGRITDSSGRPIVHARLTLDQEGWSSQPWINHFERETDAEGRFRIGKIPEGRFAFKIYQEGFMKEEVRNIFIGSGKTRELDVTLYRPASLSGRLLLDDGRTPLFNLPVTAQGPFYCSTRSNLEGIFRLDNLKPGRYRLKIYAHGFDPYLSPSPVVVSEGERTDVGPLYLHADPPQIRLAIYQDVFTQGEPLRFVIRAFRLESLQVDIHRIPESWLLEGSGDLNALTTPTYSLKEFKRVVSQAFSFDKPRPFSWSSRKFEVEKKLPPGIYLVRARGGPAEARHTFFVSNLGVAAKRSLSELLVYAMNLETNRAVPDTRIYLIGAPSDAPRTPPSLLQRILALFRPHQTPVTGRTDPTGMFWERHPPKKKNLRIVAVKPGIGIAVCNAFLSESAKTTGKRILVYTDRPLYRPGHTVHFKAILKQYEKNRILPAPHQGKKVSVEVTDSRDEVVFSDLFPIDPQGCVTGSFPLGPSSSLGEYTLSIKGFGSGSASFFVRAYRKPDFQVRIQPDRSVYMDGDPVSVKIEARYFMGAPLRNAPLTYRVYESIREVPESDSWWQASYYESAGYLRLIKEGEGITDQQGFFRFRFLPPPRSYSRTLTIYVDATAPSGRTAGGSTDVAYERTAYRLHLHLDRVVFRTDETPFLICRVKDLKGNPVPGLSLSLTMNQEVWNPLRRSYQEGMTPIWANRLVTDAQGRVALKLPLHVLKPGCVDLRASAVDPKGRRISDTIFFWVYQEGDFDAEYDYPPLTLVLDKDSYAPGDTARLVINSSIPHAEILFTLESTSILSQKRFALTGKSRVVEIPVSAEYMPNIYVSVLTHRGKKLYSSRVSLHVPVQNRDFRIQAVFDKTEYRPGDRATLTVTCRDAEGRPVSADLSVAVVDEALFQLEPDPTPDPTEFFYAFLPPFVSTTYSFPLHHIGGATKDTRDSHIRRNMKDNAFWLPHLAVGASGKAEVSFQVPDNLTTWRTTLLGHTPNGMFSRKRVRVLASKPLVVGPRPPRFLVAGDRMAFTAVVTNRTKQPMEHVSTLLQPLKGVSITGTTRKEISLPPGGTARVDWSLCALDRPRAAIRVTGRSGEHRDSVEVRFPIVGTGLPCTLGTSGWIREGHGRALLEIPETISLSRARLQIHVASHPLLSAMAAIPYLTGFPYGCVEQTLNAFLPVAVGYNTLSHLGAPVKDLPRLKERVQEGFRKLDRFILSNGEVSWRAAGEGDPYLTTLTYFTLQESDLPAPGINLDAMKSAIIRFLRRERSSDMFLFMLLALSSGGYRNPELAAGIAEKYLDKLDALDLALAIPVWHRHNMKTQVNKAIQRLNTFKRRDYAGTYFVPPPSYDSEITTLELNAFCLLALAEVDPTAPVVGELTRWLLAQRRGSRWESTRATGLILLAMSKVLAAQNKPISLEPHRISLSINGRKAGEATVTPQSLLKGEGIPLPAASPLLKQGTNTIAFVNDPPSDLYYSITLDSTEQGDYTNPVSYGCVIPLDKTLHQAVRVLDFRDRPHIVPAPLPDALHPGDEVLVRLSFVPDRDYSYMILEDYLPAAFETVDFDTMAQSAWWPSYDWKERHDRHVAFFFSHLEEGKEVQIEYVLRAESPGRFRVRPAVLRSFYRPRIRAVSTEGELNVQP